MLSVNRVLANPKGVDEPWAVTTDERPSLETLCNMRYGFV
jgi:hypothetical protein